MFFSKRAFNVLSSAAPLFWWQLLSRLNATLLCFSCRHALHTLPIIPRRQGRYSQLPFSQASELVRDGAPNSRCRPIVHRLSSEALSYCIDRSVCARSCHSRSCARTASFVGKPERQLQLHDRMRFEM